MTNLDDLKATVRKAAGGPDNVIDPGVCHWCGKNCGGTCLGVNHEGGPRQMKTSDPAYWMLKDGKTSSTTVYEDGCYICEDPEFAQMGLPLCKPCPVCTAKEGHDAGHVPADDSICSVCGADAYEEWLKEQDEKQRKVEQTDVG